MLGKGRTLASSRYGQAEIPSPDYRRDNKTAKLRQVYNITKDFL